ncbi:hypothetical protein [Roseicyclus sp.]
MRGLIIAVAAAGFSGPAAAYSERMGVAEACVGVVEYAREISRVAALSSLRSEQEASLMLSQLASQYQGTVDLFSVVGGPRARDFALVEMDGVRGIDRLARACIEQSSCGQDELEVMRGFAFFLLDACRQDYEESE